MNEHIDTVIQSCCRATEPSKSFTEGMNHAFAAIRKESSPKKTAHQPQAGSTKPSPSHRNRSSVFTASWFPRAAAIAVVAAIGFGGTAFATGALGFLEVKTTGSFQAEVTPQAGDEAAPPAPQDDQVETVRLDFSYLPESLPDRTLGEDSGCLMDELSGWSQLSPSIDYYTCYLDTLDTAPFSSLEASETLEINGREAVLLEFNYGIYEGEDQKRLKLLISYPELRRIVSLETSYEDLRDELFKVAEGITLTATGEYQSIEYELLWSQMANQAIEDAKERSSVAEEGGIQSWHAVPEEGMPDEEMGAFLAVGDVFHPAGNTAIEGRVAKVTATDNVSTLDPELMPPGWSDFIGSDGTLSPDEIVFVAHGDGQNTMDEIIDRQTSPLKAVVADITFKNTGSEPCEEIPTHVYLKSVDHQDGVWTPYDRAVSLPSNVEAQNSLFINNHFCYYYESLSDNVRWNGSCGGINLNPGEEVTLRFAWIVNADELDKLLILVDPDGYSEEAGLDYGQRFVDIRQ